MYANEPLILAVMLADRRADLLRIAVPRRDKPPKRRSRRLRRLLSAVMRSTRPRPRPTSLDEQAALDSDESVTPALDTVLLDQPLDQDHETRDLVSVG